MFVYRQIVGFRRSGVNSDNVLGKNLKSREEYSRISTKSDLKALTESIGSQLSERARKKG